MLRNLLTSAILLACLALTSLTNPQSAAAQKGTPVTLAADEPAHQMITGLEDGDSIGRYIAAGDIDGDGATDLVVIGRSDSEDTGRFQLYYGNEDGFDNMPAWTLDSENPAYTFYWAGKPAVGDLNGDGYDDIALGEPAVDGNTGRALLFYGGPDGPAGVPDWRYDGDAAERYMASGLAMGDVNADGYPDLVVAALHDLSIWFGGEDGVADEPDQVVEGAGIIVDTGDFNGDGVDDVFAVASGDDKTSTVQIFLGLDGRGLSARPTWILEGEGESNSLGSSLANAGDLNGDGFADLIVGDPSLYSDRYGTHAYVLYGSDLTPRGTARLDAAYLEWSVSGNEHLDGLGRAVSPVGDVDGDGYDDALVGAPGVGESAGEAQIYRGGPDGLANTPSWVLGGEEEGDYFGNAAAHLGDLNGDGYADFVVAAAEYHVGERLGRLYLYRGGSHLTKKQTAAQTARSVGRPASNTQPVSQPAWSPAHQLRISGTKRNEAFGWPAQIVGDVNGDGYGDLVVGSLGNPEEQMSGRLLLYYGGEEGPGDSPDWEVSSETWGGEEDLFVAIMLAPPGDVNGDGFDDLAVTAIDFDGESTKVLLYFGGADGLIADPQEIPPPVMEELIFGIHLWAAGDVNGDGYADLAVAGLDGRTDGLPVYIYHGGADGVGEEPVWTVADLTPVLGIGVGFAAAGDVTGDGFDDVMVGSPGYPENEERGQVRLYAGGPDGLAEEPTWTQDGRMPEGFFGLNIANLGDVDGDGHTDLAVVEPDEGGEDGRIIVYLGSAGGPQEWREQSLRLELEDGIFGVLVFGPGDVNGDGYNDLLAGSLSETSGDTLLWHLFMGSGDGLLPNPVFETTTPNADEEFILLQRVGSGDLNGDGYTDFALSTLNPAMLERRDSFEAGEVHVYMGGPGVGGETPFGVEVAPGNRSGGSRQVIDNGEPGEIFGWPALIVGDINGDGFDDLAINSLGNPEAQMHGRVALYLGAEEGLGDVPDWQDGGPGWADPGEEDAVFIGLGVGAVGDINSDGYDDMAVTAVDMGDEIAKVLIHHGTPDGLDDVSYRLTPPDVASEELIFGVRVDAAGDVNGDGYDDLAVLALDDPEDQLVLFVYHGGPDGATGRPAWLVDSLEAFEDVGVGFSGVGDVDGDGYDDFLIGAPAYPEDEESGQLRLYLGGPDGLAPEPTWTQEGETPEGYFGLSVANAGDVNGDGYRDIAVAEPGYADSSGRVVIYFGGEAGLDAQARQLLDVEIQDGVFGALVFGVGDTNGDGYDDLVVGSIEEVGEDTLLWQLFAGSGDGLLAVPSLNVSTVGMEEDFIFLTSMGRGDLNGDGYADMALSEVDLAALLDGGPGSGEVIVHYGGSPQDEGDEPSGQVQLPESATIVLPPSAQVAATDLQILAEHSLDEGYRYLSLSPDGDYLLAERDGELLCILSTVTLSEESCVAWEPTLYNINYGHLTWSPDSRYVALTEDSIRFFYESDIWVLDVVEARLRNLTDDGVQGAILQEGAMVDAAPAWSPDGSKLLFARSKRLDDGEWDGTALYILDMGDGSSTKLMTITDDVVQVVPYTPHWLPDGSTILYSILFPTEQEENGIWSARQDGGGVRQLLASTNEGPMPVLTDVSIATATGLVWYPSLALQQSATGSPFALVQLETGEVEGLTPAEYEGDSFAGPYAATFSPDGSKLLYTYRGAEDDFYLSVRDLQSGDEAVLLRGDEVMGVVVGGIPALDWASNDLLFVGTLGHGLLLEVGGPAQESDAAGQLEVDIGYRGNFYVETFGYAPDAPNIAHYALIIPEEERERFEGVPVFTSILMPAAASDAIELREERQEYGWILDYLHQAPEGEFRGDLASGTYLVKVAFLAGPVSREEAGVAADAILWAGVTGGGASTEEYTEVDIEPGQVHSLRFTLSDANGWACPWLYVHDGNQYVRVTEILRNVRSQGDQTRERTKLGAIPVINGAIRVQIAEEKAETSYIDQFALMVDGMRLLPDGQAADVTSLADPDQEYLVLRQGDTVELIFQLPPALNDREEVDVTVIADGYYVPGR